MPHIDEGNLVIRTPSINTDVGLTGMGYTATKTKTLLTSLSRVTPRSKTKKILQLEIKTGNRGRYVELSTLRPPVKCSPSEMQKPENVYDFSDILGFRGSTGNCTLEIGDRNIALVKEVSELERFLDNSALSMIDNTIENLDILLPCLIDIFKSRSVRYSDLAILNCIRLILQKYASGDIGVVIFGILNHVCYAAYSRLGGDIDTQFSDCKAAYTEEPNRMDTEGDCVILIKDVFVRLRLANLLSCILDLVSVDGANSYITKSVAFLETTTSLLCCMLHDDYVDVQKVALGFIERFCRNFKLNLIHVSKNLAECITCCVSHNHSDIRIASLRAISSCLLCSTWKYTFDIIGLMSGYSDPNYIPIKTVYQGRTRINYLSSLVFDSSLKVRRYTQLSIGYWLLHLDDYTDIQSHVAPYLLCGLSDSDAFTRLISRYVIECLGDRFYREGDRSDLHRMVQLGIESPWTYGQKTIPIDLKFVALNISPASPLLSDMENALKAVISENKYFDQYKPNLGVSRSCDGNPCESTLMVNESDDSNNENLQNKEDAVSIPLRVKDALSLFSRRPRLQVRKWVTTTCRRYVTAATKSVVDFQNHNTHNVLRLLGILCEFMEDSIAEWIPQIFDMANRVYQTDHMASNLLFDDILHLIGMFVAPTHFLEILQKSDHPNQGRILLHLLDGNWKVYQSAVLSNHSCSEASKYSGISIPIPKINISEHLHPLSEWVLSLCLEGVAVSGSLVRILSKVANCTTETNTDSTRIVPQIFDINLLGSAIVVDSRRILNKPNDCRIQNVTTSPGEVLKKLIVAIIPNEAPIPLPYELEQEIIGCFKEKRVDTLIAQIRFSSIFMLFKELKKSQVNSNTHLALACHLMSCINGDTEETSLIQEFYDVLFEILCSQNQGADLTQKSLCVLLCSLTIEKRDSQLRRDCGTSVSETCSSDIARPTTDLIINVFDRLLHENLDYSLVPVLLVMFLEISKEKLGNCISNYRVAIHPIRRIIYHFLMSTAYTDVIRKSLRDKEWGRLDLQSRAHLTKIVTETNRVVRAICSIWTTKTVNVSLIRKCGPSNNEHINDILGFLDNSLSTNLTLLEVYYNFRALSAVLMGPKKDNAKQKTSPEMTSNLIDVPSFTWNRLIRTMIDILLTKLQVTANDAKRIFPKAAYYLEEDNFMTSSNGGKRSPQGLDNLKMTEITPSSRIALIVPRIHIMQQVLHYILYVRGYPSWVEYAEQIEWWFDDRNEFLAKQKVVVLILNIITYIKKSKYPDLVIAVKDVYATSRERLEMNRVDWLNTMT